MDHMVEADLVDSHMEDLEVSHMEDLEVSHMAGLEDHLTVD